MFSAVGQLPEDLHRFIAQPESVTLPFSFNEDELGAAIIQIAAGKAPVDLIAQAGATDSSSTDHLRAAAQRFVATVMLSRTSDLFTVLGVSQTSALTACRDNYRRLMAMVHPDARPVGFPIDAAIRVNHAYAVLSDPEQRENYKSQRETSRESALHVPPSGGNVQSSAHARLDSSVGFVARVGALLFRVRERGLLLWLALLLMVPVGSALYLTLSENPHVRLVEARSQLGASAAGAALAPAQSSALIAPTATATRADKAEKESTEGARNNKAPVRAPLGSQRSDSPVAISTTPTPALAFETSLSMSKLATLVSPAAPVPLASPTPISPQAKGIGSLAPTPSFASAQIRAAAVSGTEVTRTSPASVAPAAPLRAEVPAVEPTQPASATAVPTRAPTTEARGSSAAATSAPPGARPRSVDVEQALARFSSAYESGSLSGFDQILAPGMPGRSQLLADYGRVFQGTRNRTIRFVQLKHASAGERMATRGYAEVTTTDQDNRVSKQRVYLEIEVGIEHSVPRIERISNYVVN